MNSTTIYYIHKYIFNLKYRHVNKTIIYLPSKYLHKSIKNELSNAKYSHVIFAIENNIKILPIIKNLSNDNLREIILCACKHNNMNILEYMNKQINLSAFIVNQYIDQKCWKMLTNIKLIKYFHEKLKIICHEPINIYPSINVRIIKYLYSNNYKINICNDIYNNIHSPEYTIVCIYFQKINKIISSPYYAALHENVRLIKYFKMTDIFGSQQLKDIMFNNIDIIKYLHIELNFTQLQFEQNKYIIYNIDVMQYLYNIFGIKFAGLYNEYYSPKCKDHKTVMFVHNTFGTEITLKIYYWFFILNNMESIKYWHDTFKNDVNVEKILNYAFNNKNIEMVKWIRDNYNITNIPNVPFPIGSKIGELSFELIMTLNPSQEWLINNMKYYVDIKMVKYLCENNIVDNKYIVNIFYNSLKRNKIKTIKYLVNKYKIPKFKFLDIEIIQTIEYICTMHFEMLKYLHKDIGFTKEDFIKYNLFTKRKTKNFDIIRYIHEDIGFNIVFMKKCIYYYDNNRHQLYNHDTIRYLHEMFGIVKSDFEETSTIIDNYYKKLN